MINWLSGKKTYVITAVGVAALLAVNVFSVPIPGMSPDPAWIGSVFSLLGLGALRAGVAKQGS